MLVLSSSILQSLLANSLSESRESDIASSGKVWVAVTMPLRVRSSVEVASAVVPLGNATVKGVRRLESVNVIVGTVHCLRYVESEVVRMLWDALESQISSMLL